MSLSIKLMVSSGDDTRRLRDIVIDVVRRVEHLFTYQLRYLVSIKVWDYRLDTPQVVGVGDLHVRSLRMVEKSDCVIAILGKIVPPITRREILHTFECRRDGIAIRPMLFVNSSQKTVDHEALLQAISDICGIDVSYTPYASRLDFQAAVMTALVEYVLLRMQGQPVTANWRLDV